MSTPDTPQDRLAGGRHPQRRCACFLGGPGNLSGAVAVNTYIKCY